MTLAMKMEVKNQLHIDWGRNRDWLLGGRQNTIPTERRQQGCERNRESGDQVLATSDPWGILVQRTKLLSGP